MGGTLHVAVLSCLVVGVLAYGLRVACRVRILLGELHKDNDLSARAAARLTLWRWAVNGAALVGLAVVSIVHGEHGYDVVDLMLTIVLIAGVLTIAGEVYTRRHMEHAVARMVDGEHLGEPAELHLFPVSDDDVAEDEAP